MRVVWVLTVLHLVAGGPSGVDANSARTVPAHAADPQYEQLTIGFYESKAECDRMRAQLANAPGFEPGSARCAKDLK